MKPHFRVRPSRLRDCFDIEAKIRPADLLELHTLDGPEKPVSETLKEGMKFSTQPWSLTMNGDAIAMFGVVPVVPASLNNKKQVGSIWLLGTTDIEKAQVYFIRHSREWLRRISANFDIVGNAVHHENSLHLRWLDWLGFDFGLNKDIFGDVHHPFVLASRRVDI